MTDAVGLIGWGQMGGAIGARLLARGRPVLMFDAAAPARQQAADAGAEVAESASEVVNRSETFVTVLPDEHVIADVHQGHDGIGGALREGHLWIEMSSALPSATAALADEVVARGVAFLDAPVTGGVAKAREGRLTVIAAGTDATLRRARPILEDVAEQIPHVSQRPGGGDLVKTVNNLLSAANLAIAAEGLRLAEAGGIEPSVLLDVLNHGTGQSNATSWKIPNYVLPQNFDSGFALGQYVKDLGIALRTSEEFGLQLDIASQVAGLWNRLADAGHTGSDHTYAAQLIREGS